MKAFFKNFLIPVLLATGFREAAAQKFTVITTLAPPVTPYFNQLLTSRNLNVLAQFSPPDSFYTVYAAGVLTRLAPTFFSIELNPNAKPSQSFPLGPNSPQRVLSTADRSAAFANFGEQDLLLNGISLNDIREGPNYKLPDGQYMLCFYLRGTPFQFPNQARDLTSKTTGCRTFTICNGAGSAPQFTQPFSNLTVSSSVPVLRLATPVVFTWTPPQSVCGLPPGGYRYDFEMWEMAANQTVTDAVNNPFVFRKAALPSTTFLLDTNLYRNVLQAGKRYAVRVRATNASLRDTFAIENNGYSRVEAFQYGTAPDVVAAPFPVQRPAFYYIPFGERKTTRWDDVYTAYRKGIRSDTAVPIKEYIALNLIQNGIAYGPDAIELFLALNPELGGLPEVKLSHVARLPEFPTVADADRRTFNEQHATNLLPDVREVTRFRNLLDSLKAAGYPQGTGDAISQMITALTVELNNFNKTVQGVNRISVGLINQLLAELLYNLRQRAQNVGTGNNDHLRSVVLNIRDLMANAPNSTSLLLPPPAGQPALLPSRLPLLQISLAGYPKAGNRISAGGLPAAEGPLLPLDVVVWRGATEPPARPVSAAPDLTAAYRIFYTTPPLYNHKNPVINATSLPGLASTAQISLPKLAQFKFWTLNMVNHKMTKAVDVETNDVFLLNNKKKWPNSKKLYVVLKVD